MPLYKPQSPLGAATTTMGQAASTAGGMMRRSERRNDDDDWLKTGMTVANGLMGVANGVGNLIQTGQKIGAENRRVEDEKGVNEAYEYIANKVGEAGGDISVLDGDPRLNTRYGAMATGKFTEMQSQTQESRLNFLKKKDAENDHYYVNTFRPMAVAAQEALAKGDAESFGGIVDELSAKAPLPYKTQRNSDGTFNLLFRSDRAGGYTDTGERLTAEQVMQQLKGLLSSEQKILSGIDGQVRVVNPGFNAAAARYQLATREGNAKTLADPTQWIPMQKGGKTVWIVPQNRHDDYSVGPSYRVIDDSGQMGGMAPSLDGLMQEGWVRADVKAKLDLTRNQAAYAGRRGLGGGGSGDLAISQGAMNTVKNFATTTDEEGNKSIDYGKANLLHAMMKQYGLSEFAAIAAYQENIERAMQVAKKQGQDITLANAERAVQAAFARQLAGRPQNNAPGGAGQKTGTPQPGNGGPPNTTVRGRITGALSGEGGQQAPAPAAGLAGGGTNGIASIPSVPELPYTQEASPSSYDFTQIPTSKSYPTASRDSVVGMNRMSMASPTGEQVRNFDGLKNNQYMNPGKGNVVYRDGDGTLWYIHGYETKNANKSQIVE